MSDTFQSIRFSNDMWDVEIVPQLLAVNVYPAGTDVSSSSFSRVRLA